MPSAVVVVAATVAIIALIAAVIAWQHPRTGTAFVNWVKRTVSVLRGETSANTGLPVSSASASNSVPSAKGVISVGANGVPVWLKGKWRQVGDDGGIWEDTTVLQPTSSTVDEPVVNVELTRGSRLAASPATSLSSQQLSGNSIGSGSGTTPGSGRFKTRVIAEDDHLGHTGGSSSAQGAPRAVFHPAAGLSRTWDIVDLE
ncbi:hypothetical protein HDU83_006997 [Entophlyctis luteolus]|nr:hypothetical protein HDU83_006997 [Entophlyctis luteolus]KAJ3378730.1 hypothetical protein HDU84_007335 [Entophlyctis sp. JEL0112]